MATHRIDIPDLEELMREHIAKLDSLRKQNEEMYDFIDKYAYMGDEHTVPAYEFNSVLQTIIEMRDDD